MPDGTNMPNVDLTRKKVPMLNAWVHDVSMDEVVETFTTGTMLTLHVDIIMKLQQDREFYDLLDKFDVITCDSQIMYFATKWLGTPVQERVSGSDYFPKFYMHHKDNPDITVFLLGGKEGIADLAADGQQGIQGVHRLLKHHADLSPTHAMCFSGFEIEKIMII